MLILIILQRPSTKNSCLQYTEGRDNVGVVTQLEVTLLPDVDPDHIAATIDEKLLAGSVATTTRRKGAFQASTLSDLVDLIGFAHWLGLACVGLVLSLVATTTVMSVQDRIKEYAVLQTLGVRPLNTFALVLAESCLLCFFGGMCGTLVAMTALWLGGWAIGAEGATIAFRPSVVVAGSSLLVSLSVGLLAGIGPAFQATTSPILDSLQAP